MDAKKSRPPVARGTGQAETAAFSGQSFPVIILSQTARAVEKAAGLL